MQNKHPTDVALDNMDIIDDTRPSSIKAQKKKDMARLVKEKIKNVLNTNYRAVNTVEDLLAVVKANKDSKFLLHLNIESDEYGRGTKAKMIRFLELALDLSTIRQKIIFLGVSKDIAHQFGFIRVLGFDKDDKTGEFKRMKGYEKNHFKFVAAITKFLITNTEKDPDDPSKLVYPESGQEEWALDEENVITIDRKAEFLYKDHLVYTQQNHKRNITRFKEWRYDERFFLETSNRALNRGVLYHENGYTPKEMTSEGLENLRKWHEEDEKLNGKTVTESDVSTDDEEMEPMTSDTIELIKSLKDKTAEELEQLHADLISPEESKKLKKGRRKNV